MFPGDLVEYPGNWCNRADWWTSTGRLRDSRPRSARGFQQDGAVSDRLWLALLVRGVLLPVGFVGVDIRLRDWT